MSIKDLIKSQEDEILRFKEQREKVILQLRSAEEDMNKLGLNIIRFVSPNNFWTDSLSLLDNEDIEIYSLSKYFYINYNKNNIILNYNILKYYNYSQIEEIIDGGRKKIIEFAKEFKKMIIIKDILE
jgi:RecA-family ATPase